MWKVDYTKRFLKELSELPKEIQGEAERIVFEELLTSNPFSLGYLERMRGYPDILLVFQLSFCAQFEPFRCRPAHEHEQSDTTHAKGQKYPGQEKGVEEIAEPRIKSPCPVACSIRGSRCMRG